MAVRSYHMAFQKGYSGGLNRCGGLPTHLPEAWPQIDGTDLTFLFQLYCDGEKLDIPNTLCIQGYQLIEDGHYDSDIVVIQLPLGARENTRQAGRSAPVSPEYEGGDIVFEAAEEQEYYDLEVEDRCRFEREFDRWWEDGVPRSKLLGWCGPELIPSGYRFLGWLGDEDPFVIGAGYYAYLFLTPDGRVVTEYHRPC